ncbi:MAG: translesion error-prone DNA polymerase V autoproteolytic subunit [Pseudomonadota bacterium]
MKILVLFSIIEKVSISEKFFTMLIPMPICSVQAGFPSPADDYIETNLSLDDYLIDQPAATLFVRVRGISMVDAGIVENDILVVNRALTAKNGDIVIACIAGEYTLKKLRIDEKSWLEPANPDFPKIELKSNTDDFIFGVVSGVVRKLR